MNSQFEETNKNISQLQEEEKILTDKKERLENEVGELEDKVQGLQEKAERLEGEVGNLNGQVNKLTEEIGSLQEKAKEEIQKEKDPIELSLFLLFFFFLFLLLNLVLREESVENQNEQALLRSQVCFFSPFLLLFFPFLSFSLLYLLNFHFQIE